MIRQIAGGGYFELIFHCENCDIKLQIYTATSNISSEANPPKFTCQTDNVYAEIQKPPVKERIKELEGELVV